MPKLELDKNINDLVDDVYDAFEINEEWTAAMHRRATDKIKADARQLVQNGRTLGDALQEAIRIDSDGDEGKFSWLEGRLDDAIATRGDNPKKTEADAKRDRHALIDNERVEIAGDAITALYAREDLDETARYYARSVILFFMNARAQREGDRRTKGNIAVAADKAMDSATAKHTDLSDDETKGLRSAIDTGKQLLLTAVKAFNEAKHGDDK